MAKKKMGYLIFDLPSDHEVEESLSTECDTIQAIISNKGMSARIKRIKVASTERFKAYPTYKYQVQFVHLACHGGKTGIGMLGGNVKWADVAKQVTRHLKPLTTKQKRVMCFSCCFSKYGFNQTKNYFKDYFSGAYYFAEEKIAFSTSITTWSMFYLRKKISRPHGAIVKAINEFMKSEVIIFRTY
jgi:hypothetical protein